MPTRPRIHRRAAAILLPVLLLSLSSLRAQTQPETVGRIEGDDIEVKGQVSMLRENDRSTTVLASGSEVLVRSGQARILLVEGGEIDICGPAHFTLLKAGGSITLALNYGRVRARLENSMALSIYTPLIVVTPLAIADRPREVTIGLEPSGSICVLARSGAVRVEEQLTGQALVVPQAGEVTLAGGQLQSASNAPGSCRCEPMLAKAEPPSAAQPAAISVSVPAKPVQQKPPGATQDPPKPPAVEKPTWTVVMPPLTFDASNPLPPPEPSPETILLVREVRVEPAVVFTGRVEPIQIAAKHREQAATQQNDPVAGPRKKSGGVFGKIGHFFHRLFGGGKSSTASPASQPTSQT